MAIAGEDFWEKGQKKLPNKEIEGMGYTGDVSVENVWKALQENEKSVLVDVRTQPEWAFAGICDLSSLGKSPLLVSWLEFPHMDVNTAFAEVINDQNIPKDAPLYFLCRSGVRSKAAAAAMIAAGFDKCFNIIDGFEGNLDGDGHRGAIGGWKASGLPWIQN